MLRSVSSRRRRPTWPRSSRRAAQALSCPATHPSRGSWRRRVKLVGPHVWSSWPSYGGRAVRRASFDQLCQCFVRPRGGGQQRLSCANWHRGPGGERSMGSRRAGAVAPDRGVSWGQPPSCAAAAGGGGGRRALRCWWQADRQVGSGNEQVAEMAGCARTERGGKERERKEGQGRVDNALELQSRSSTWCAVQIVGVE